MELLAKLQPPPTRLTRTSGCYTGAPQLLGTAGNIHCLLSLYDNILKTYPTNGND
jgi:hypothetical protein